MITKEITLAIAGVALCAAIATLLMMQKRYQRQERIWEARLRTASASISAERAEMAAAITKLAATQTEVLAAQIEISVARSMAVAAEEARIVALAMAEAAQAEADIARKSPDPETKAAKTKKARPIPKPATPCSCQQCQLESAVQSVGINDANDGKAPPPLLPAYLWPFVRNEDIIPYAQLKSKRGRQKTHNTDGAKRACPHLDCRYRGITDSATHALIAYGNHGRKERIPDLYCQACKRKTTARTMTALFGLRKPSEHIITTLNTLVEGMSEEGAVRGLAFYKLTSDSIRRWVTRAAQHTATLQAILLKDLRFKVLQLDELRAKLRTPTQVIVEPYAKADKRDALITWGWTAICR